MKKLSKILSLVLALAMVVMSINVMVVNANQSQTGTIKITGIDVGSSAEFVAYQIFRGSSIGENSDVYDPQSGRDGDEHIISNIAYSTYVDSNKAKFINALNGVKVSGKNVFNPALELTASAATVAEALSKVGKDHGGDDSREVGAVASALKGFFSEAEKTYKANASGGTCTINSVPEGYYLIVDTTADSVLPGLLRVIDNLTNSMEIKDVDPTVEKEVTYTDGYTYGIGDTVPFKVTIHIPADVTLYDKFDITLVDKATNMKFDPATLDIKVTVNGIPQDAPVKDGTTEHYTYKITSDEEGGTDNVLTLKHNYDSVGDADHWDNYADKEMVVTYNAVLTSNAYQFDQTTNKATITYTNGPETQGTSESTVKVLNLGLTLNKVTGEGDPYTPLGGAGFKVEKWSESEWVELENGVNSQITETTVGSGVGTGANKFVYRSLGDGWYRITESKVPEGYNTWATKIIHVETTLNNPNTANTTLNSYNITAYDDYAEFDGTDTGLQNADPSLFTCQTADGMATANIVNNKGTSLPETGGMGTKIFYALGGLLVACAVVLLVVKRRMRAE